jgi:hypothetical protein
VSRHNPEKEATSGRCHAPSLFLEKHTVQNLDPLEKYTVLLSGLNEVPHSSNREETTPGAKAHASALLSIRSSFATAGE